MWKRACGLCLPLIAMLAAACGGNVEVNPSGGGAGGGDCTADGVTGICAPAGAYGPVRTCVVAHCKTSADCDVKAGGVCAPIQNPCCKLPQGLACVYPGGCQKLADCKNNQYCTI